MLHLKDVLTNFANPQENTYVEIRSLARSFVKKRLQHKCFFREICKKLKNTVFTENL